MAPAVILLVEDDALVQLDLANWLIDQGLTVLCADSADEASVILASRLDIQWLLTDIQTPGAMDGIELSHHVAEGWPRIKILVMSGLCETALSSLPPGSLFFPKPLEREKLRRALSGYDATRPIAPLGPRRPPPRFGCV
jgi:DNA-binding NtrC family response regulator